MYVLLPAAGITLHNRIEFNKDFCMCGVMQAEISFISGISAGGFLRSAVQDLAPPSFVQLALVSTAQNRRFVVVDPSF